jgi:hypothetical protein
VNTNGGRNNSNQIDLRILKEMGIDINRKKYEKPLSPKQKFRAGVYTVIAAMRLSDMQEDWQVWKKVGSELKAAGVSGSKDRSSRTEGKGSRLSLGHGQGQNEARKVMVRAV